MKKSGTFRGILWGAAIGAAAATVIGMMDERAMQKMRACAAASSQKLSQKANELFGK